MCIPQIPPAAITSHTVEKQVDAAEDVWWNIIISKRQRYL